MLLLWLILQLETQIVISGISRHDKGMKIYQQYIEHLWNVIEHDCFCVVFALVIFQSNDVCLIDAMRICNLLGYSLCRQSRLGITSRNSLKATRIFCSARYRFVSFTSALKVRQVNGVSCANRCMCNCNFSWIICLDLAFDGQLGVVDVRGVRERPDQVFTVRDGCLQGVAGPSARRPKGHQRTVSAAF